MRPHSTFNPVLTCSLTTEEKELKNKENWNAQTKQSLVDIAGQIKKGKDEIEKIDKEISKEDKKAGKVRIFLQHCCIPWRDMDKT